MGSSTTSSGSSRRRRPCARACSLAAGAISGNPSPPCASPTGTSRRSRFPWRSSSISCTTSCSTAAARRPSTSSSSISTGVSDRDTRRVNRWFRHALMRQARLRLEFRWKTDFVLVLDNLPVVSRRLVKLVLTNVRLMHSFLDFSGCPVLEHLKLWRCDLSDAKRISSQSLKRITTFRCDFSDVFQTQICVPNLLTLYLCYYTNLSPVFEVVPLLTEALVGVTDGSGDWSFYPRFGHGNCMLPEVITHAEKLRLGVESPISNAQDFNFQRYWQWCPTFSKLKTLSISQCISTYFDFEAICCILRHSPVLEELALDFDEDLNIKWKLKDATVK